MPQLDEFEKQTGLDPRKDLSEVLLCSNGKTALLLVRGKFRIADLEARFKIEGRHSRRSTKDTLCTAMSGPPSIFSTIPRLPPDHPPSCARLSIDPVPDGVFRRTFAICCARCPASDQVYAALTGGLEHLNLPLPREGNLGNILEALRSVDSATLGMNLSKGIDAVAAVNCNTERDAKFVHDLVRGLVGFGRLNTPRQSARDAQALRCHSGDAAAATDQGDGEYSAELADRFIDLWREKGFQDLVGT